MSLLDNVRHFSPPKKPSVPVKICLGMGPTSLGPPVPDKMDCDGKRQKTKSRIRPWIARKIFKLGPEPNIRRFSVEKAFPPSDPLAIDLLRLIAAYNDFSSVDEWLLQDLARDDQNLSYVSSIQFTVSKMNLQFRLLGSVLHETIQTLDEFAAASSSQKVLQQLDDAGRGALQKLLAIPRGTNSYSRRVLAVTRNKLSYHYDKKAFEDGLKTYLSSKGNNDLSTLLLLQDEAPRRAFYFRLADDVRNEVLKQYDKDGHQFQIVFETHDLSRSLLQQIVTIYGKNRGLDFVK